MDGSSEEKEDLVRAISTPAESCVLELAHIYPPALMYLRKQMTSQGLPRRLCEVLAIPDVPSSDEGEGSVKSCSEAVAKEGSEERPLKVSRNAEGDGKLASDVAVGALLLLRASEIHS
jgi:hypothetical protein